MTVLALVGCGGIARDGYLPAIGHLRPNSVLTYDLDPAAAEHAQTELVRFGVNAHAVSDLIAVAESDAVIVAVPPSQLRTTVSSIAADRSDLAILLEKPLGPTFDIARSTIEDINGNARIYYMETFLHSTAYDVLVDELGTGRLGAAQRLSCRVKGGTPSDLEHQWRGSRTLGGEVLHDWGVHSLGLALHFLGAIGLGSSDTDPDVEVTASEWATFGKRRVLTSCTLNLRGLAIPVEVEASWSGPSRSMESPDVLVECERGALGLHVRKTEGSSDWTCVEHAAPGVTRILACRRYPKELFIRGVSGFLDRDNSVLPADQSKFSVGLGMEALRLADDAYNQARPSSSTSSN